MESTSLGQKKPRLDTRLEGVLFSCTSGDSTHYYNFNYEAGIKKVLFNGVETFAFDSNPGDYVTLWTEYFVPPMNAWKRYKKFGKKYYVFPNTTQKNILFPTEPTIGVRLVVKYHNTGTDPVNYALNLFNFVDRQTIDTSTASEGVDW